MSAAPAAGQGRARSAGGEMLARFASAGVLAALTLLCAWLGGWPAAIGVSIVVAVVYGEWAALTRDDLWPTLVFTAALVAAFAALAAGFAGVALGVAVAAIVVAGVLSRGPWRPVGVAYGAILGFGLLLLRLAPEHGLAAVVFLFAVVWGGDTGAFFIGRAIGGPKLWPAVSPKKTWAGGAGGLVAGVVAGLIVVGVAGLPVTAGVVAVAVLLSLAEQAGDLFESWVKRRFGAKDSGQIVPGHGGLMDRVDGLVFAAGLAVVIGLAHGGSTNLAGGLLVW